MTECSEWSCEHTNAATSTRHVGAILRSTRASSGRTREDLAMELGVESGVIRDLEHGQLDAPIELLEEILECLDVPLRQRRAILDPLIAAASRRPDIGPALKTLRAVVERHPGPGLLLSRSWDVIIANDAASDLIGRVHSDLRAPTPNWMRIRLHPCGLAHCTEQFEHFARIAVRGLRRDVRRTADERLAVVLHEVLRYPGVSSALDRPAAARAPLEPALRYVLHLPHGTRSYLSTTTTLSHPLSSPCDEVRIELLHET